MILQSFPLILMMAFVENGLFFSHSFWIISFNTNNSLSRSEQKVIMNTQWATGNKTVQSKPLIITKDPTDWIRIVTIYPIGVCISYGNLKYEKEFYLCRRNCLNLEIW